mmetsp:Transcript_16021/g.24234  ORF Transcript_16021/g.24234 Transcript_16021/m.24234 type:complete len:267 (+) Transcript_16021:73-873(+)
MTSAFSPVIQRAGSPRVNSVRLPLRRASSRTSKRERQASSLSDMLGQPLELVAESSREEGESPCPPDNISTSASEDSASNGSQAPKILDFIGATCEVTSWFTSCFPCAVVDIDEQDGRVMDRLSKESAMNTMYNSPAKVEADEPLHEEAPQVDYQDVANEYSHLPYVVSPQIGAVDSDVMYTHLPIMTVADSDHIRSQGIAHKLHVIEDDEATEVETVSLNSERQAASPVQSQGRKKHTIVPKKVKKLFRSGSKKKNGGRPKLVRG